MGALVKIAICMLGLSLAVKLHEVGKDPYLMGATILGTICIIGYIHTIAKDIRKQ